jgi:hypothetical protein
MISLRTSILRLRIVILKSLKNEKSLMEFEETLQVLLPVKAVLADN